MTTPEQREAVRAALINAGVLAEDAPPVSESKPVTSKYADRQFWADTLDRAVSTTAQAGVAALTVSGISGLFDVTWPLVLSTAGLAGVVSVLQSIAFRGKPAED